MPARSTVAAPDKELQAEISGLKKQVSDLGNANIQLSKDLGAAQKDQNALAEASHDLMVLKSKLDTANSQILHLEAELQSTRSKGSSDDSKIAAAEQIAEGLKKLL